MIAIDASALLSILLKEEDAPKFATRVVEAGGGVISAVNFWEVLVRAELLHGDAGRLRAERLLSSLGIQVVSATPEQSRSAADAFSRYGRHMPADLNLGDCFAYALAAEQGDGLLFKGNDFPKTDAKTAL